MSAQQHPQLVQGMQWLKQRLTSLGGASRLLGIDVGRMALNGKVNYGIRVYAKPEGKAWLQEYGFPGMIETPYGTFFAAVLGPEHLPNQQQRASQPPAAQQQPGQPPQPGQPAQQGGQNDEDPYKGWKVEYHGTDLDGAQVRYYGSEVDKMKAEIHGTRGVKPDPKKNKGGEFKIHSGCFGTTFRQFEPEE